MVSLRRHISFTNVAAAQQQQQVVVLLTNLESREDVKVLLHVSTQNLGNGMVSAHSCLVCAH